MWTTQNRGRYDRDALGYPGDPTDAEWASVEAPIPPAKPGGGKRRVDMREAVNGSIYVLSTGCQWRAIPTDLPPRSTAHGYFDLWTWDGTLERMHRALFVACREQAGREASPTAAIVDSQSVNGAGKAGRGSTRTAPHGYDAGKKLKGKKWRIPVDTCGLSMHCPVLSADWQDRDGGAIAMSALFCRFPVLPKLYADGGYRGDRFRKGVKQALRQVDVQIVKRSDRTEGFAVLPKRRVVERTFARFGRPVHPLPSIGKRPGMPQRQSQGLPYSGIHPPYAANTMQSIV